MRKIFTSQLRQDLDYFRYTGKEDYRPARLVRKTSTKYPGIEVDRIRTVLRSAYRTYYYRNGKLSTLENYI